MKDNKAIGIASAIVFVLMLVFTVYNMFYSFDDLYASAVDFADVENLEDIKDAIDDFSDNIGDSMYLHDLFIDEYGLILKSLGKKEVNNFGIIKDDSGMMYYGSVYVSPLDDVDEIVNRIAEVADAAHLSGKEFIVVLPPSKILYGISELDYNLPLNDPNAKMDKVLSGLQQRKIDAIDMRIPFVESGMSIEELFFRTDHHWTPRGAFIATDYLVEKIDEKYGISLDPTGYYTDPDNYDSVIYKDKMLGTHGRNTGIPYSGLDDFEIITLHEYENTNFLYTCTDLDDLYESKEGNVKESLYEYGELDKPTDYNQNLYALYCTHSIIENSVIINENNPDGLKLLVCRDSYFAPMACFLAPMVGEINMYYSQDDDSKEEFYEEVIEGDYDIVILEMYPYNIKLDTVSNFTED